MLRTESTQETGLTGKHSFSIAWDDQVGSLLGSGMTGYAPGDVFWRVPLLCGARREPPGES
jgi:hypothetical protein